MPAGNLPGLQQVPYSQKDFTRDLTFPPRLGCLLRGSTGYFAALGCPLSVALCTATRTVPADQAAVASTRVIRQSRRFLAPAGRLLLRERALLLVSPHRPSGGGVKIGQIHHLPPPAENRGRGRGLYFQRFGGIARRHAGKVRNKEILFQRP